MVEIGLAYDDLGTLSGGQIVQGHSKDAVVSDIPTIEDMVEGIAHLPANSCHLILDRLTTRNLAESRIKNTIIGMTQNPIGPKVAGDASSGLRERESRK